LVVWDFLLTFASVKYKFNQLRVISIMEKNNNKDNKKKIVYVVAGVDKDGITYYWHEKNQFHWNIWNSIIYYKSKQGAIRNAKKAKAIYKDSIKKTYVLQGMVDMAIADFTILEIDDKKRSNG